MPYLAGAVLSRLTIGKVGSNMNYLIELGAAVSLSLGALLAWQRPRRAAYTVVAALLALDGRPLHFQPFEMTQLAWAGRWDQRPFLHEIERRGARRPVGGVSPAPRRLSAGYF